MNDTRGLAFCSSSCSQSYRYQLDGYVQDSSSVDGLISCSSLKLCLDECDMVVQAEFVFFLHLLRAINECEIMKAVLSMDNLLERFEMLKKTSLRRSFADFIFSTDIMKLALKNQMPADRTNYVVSRVWEIIWETREKLMDGDEEPADQVEFIEREIFQAVAKTTIDNILDLGTDKYIPKEIVELEVSKSLHNSQGTNRKASVIRDGLCKSEFSGLYFLEIEEDPLKKTTFIAKENGGFLKKVIIISQEPDFSDVIFRDVAENICSEDLLISLDFIFIKRYYALDTDSIDMTSQRFTVINLDQRAWINPGEDVFLARSLTPSTSYDPVSHFVLHLNFPAQNFVKESDYFFYMVSPDEAPRLTELMNDYISKEYLPIGSKARLVLKISNLEERLTALRDLCISHISEHKMVSIEIMPDDIFFEADDEDTIYSEEEKSYFKACEHEAKSELFLFDLAIKSNLDLSVVRACMQRMLYDVNLIFVPDKKADTLRIYRCLRLKRLYSDAAEPFNLNHLSFLFAALISNHEV